MALPDGIRMVTAGTLPGGEEWTTSFFLGGQSGPFGGLDLALLCNQTMDAWADFQDDFPWLGSGVTINQVRGYVYGDGELVEQRQSNVAPITATADTRLPNQCAVVFSLTTDRPGRRYRGRMYLPILTLSMAGGGKFASSTAAGLAGAMASFLEQVGSAVPLGLRAALHPVVASAVGAGEVTDVTAVRVGDVIDTQRRRREGLIEVYSLAEVNVPG